MVYSLYGQHRKPTKEMLEDVDIICYDIQDVGADFIHIFIVWLIQWKLQKNMAKSSCI